MLEISGKVVIEVIRRTRRSFVLVRGLGLASLAVVLGSGATTSRASDHADAPNVADDPATDLGDLYAWTDDGRLVVVMTYAGGLEPGTPPVFDPDVLYSLWFDIDDDGLAERIVRMRFGQNPKTRQWGFEVRGVPGAMADLVAPVQDEASSGTALAWAGIADDPFFFDADGLEASGSGGLEFDSTRDRFAGLNTMAFVVEMDLGHVTVPMEPLQIWATAGRAR